jgi:hypothetical protein
MTSKPVIHTIPAVIYRLDEVKKLLSLRQDKAAAIVETNRRAVKAALDYQTDNNSSRIASAWNEYPFSFMFIGHISVWTMRSINIVNVHYLGAFPEIKRAIEGFDNGLVTCHGCGQVVIYENVRHNTHWAAIYCESKYKKIANSESTE